MKKSMLRVYPDGKQSVNVVQTPHHLPHNPASPHHIMSDDGNWSGSLQPKKKSDLAQLAAEFGQFTLSCSNPRRKLTPLATFVVQPSQASSLTALTRVRLSLSLSSHIYPTTSRHCWKTRAIKVNFFVVVYVLLDVLTCVSLIGLFGRRGHRGSAAPVAT